MVDYVDSCNALGFVRPGKQTAERGMRRSQSIRHDFEEPERDTGSLALYAWAGIAALSALSACLAVLSPTVTTVQMAANSGSVAVTEPSNNAAPEVVAEKISVVRTQRAGGKEVPDSAQTASELVERYGETLRDADPVTTATAVGDVETGSAVIEASTQVFSDDDAIGATIGLSDSIPELTARYAALQRRAPELFEDIQPLVELIEGSVRLEARLVAGPFAQEADLAEFCREVKLRMTIDCSAGDYSGEPLVE